MVRQVHASVGSRVNCLSSPIPRLSSEILNSYFKSCAERPAGDQKLVTRPGRAPNSGVDPILHHPFRVFLPVSCECERSTRIPVFSPAYGLTTCGSDETKQWYAPPLHIPFLVAALVDFSVHGKVPRLSPIQRPTPLSSSVTLPLWNYIYHGTGTRHTSFSPLRVW